MSHYNTTAKRNQLMEPAINADLTNAPTLPRDQVALFRPALPDLSVAKFPRGK